MIVGPSITQAHKKVKRSWKHLNEQYKQENLDKLNQNSKNKNKIAMLLFIGPTL